MQLTNAERNFLPMNIEYSASLKLPNALKGSLAEEKGVVICGTAPTLVLAPNLREIRRLVALGYKVVALKQAISILQEYEIPVGFSVAMDPSERQIKKTPIDCNVNYFIASSCHPRMFDYLLKAGAKVTIYHSACGASTHDMAEMEIYEKFYPDFCAYESVASGGYTVMNRAISLFEYLGARHIHIAGAPFGWREGSDYYAPTVTEAASNASGPTLDDKGVTDGKRWFTKVDLLPSAVSLARKVKMNPSRYSFIGDSMAASFARKSDAFLERVCPSK
jgi:hypothetical protein